MDSSVVLRIILAEPGPLAEWTAIQPVSGEITRVECLRAIERYRMTGALTDEAVVERRMAVLDTLARFRLVEATRPVLERAGDPFPVYVATLDAIHLATAVELRSDDPELVFATHDIKLASAARALDFEVVGA